MKCTKCGNRLDVTAKFCSRCGNSVENAESKIENVKEDLWSEEPVKNIISEPVVVKKEEFSNIRRIFTIIAAVNTSIFLLLCLLSTTSWAYTPMGKSSLMGVIAIISFVLIVIINGVLGDKYLKKCWPKYKKLCSTIYQALKNFIPLLGFAGIFVLIAGYVTLLGVFMYIGMVLFCVLIVGTPYISLVEMWKIKSQK